MTDRTETEPGFRKIMYGMMLVLLVGYLGFKAWHISIALEAFRDQPLQISTEGASK